MKNMLIDDLKNTVLSGPVPKLLYLLVIPALGRLIAHLVGTTGEMTISIKRLLDISAILLWVFLCLVYLAYSYWNRSLPRQKIEWAMKHGRKICHCTEIGVVMLQAKEKAQGIQDYYCPRCKRRDLKIIE
jgi:hypothetical protein